MKFYIAKSINPYEEITGISHQEAKICFYNLRDILFKYHKDQSIDLFITDYLEPLNQCCYPDWENFNYFIRNCNLKIENLSINKDYNLPNQKYPLLQYIDGELGNYLISYLKWLKSNIFIIDGESYSKQKYLQDLIINLEYYSERKMLFLYLESF